MKEESKSFPGSGKPFCVLRDLEGLRTPQEFVELLYSDIQSRMSLAERGITEFSVLLGKLGGTKILDLQVPSIAPHWKKLLFALIGDLCKRNPELTIFFWDELPLFVYNLKKVSGEESAMEFLDVLRAIRQQHSTIRMVFTGSVGLHQVISGLRNDGYANAPTNDMQTIEVPPLDPIDGVKLAELLLEGENLDCGSSRGQHAIHISALAGHVPYYIHGLIAKLASERVQITTKAIDDHLASLLTDPNDPANFRYYRDRIRTYYPKNEQPIALAILDNLCHASESIAISGILNQVRHHLTDVDEEAARDVIHLLSKDHYINRTNAGRWSFRYEIVRRWWRLERG